MPYRDDTDALALRQTQLRDELSQIEVKKRELESIEQEEKKVRDALNDVERVLTERKRSLPTLSNLRVASPCSADWNNMIGDDRVRFCGSCAKNVYNLSAMTTEQATQLVQEKEGNLCIRFYRRKDGTVMTTDCPVGRRRVRIRNVVAGAAFGLGAAMTATMAFSFRKPPATWVAGGIGSPINDDTTMGKLEVHELMMGAPIEREVEEPEDKPLVKNRPQAPIKTQGMKALGSTGAQEKATDSQPTNPPAISTWK